jgi:uncharacterized protein
MKCPVDDTDLVMTDRAGVEIDYCPKCRGVWLDRGELDKVIDRSAQLMREVQPDRVQADPVHPGAGPAAGQDAPPAYRPAAAPPPLPSPLLKEPGSDGRYGERGERFGQPTHERPRGEQTRDGQRFEQPGYDRPRYDQPRHDDDRYHRDERGYDRKYGKYGDQGRRRKKDNWLGELFDF